MEINDKVKQPRAGEKAVAQAGISGAHKLNETHENVVWTQSGIVTAWSDAPIANFELDVDALLADQLQHDADRESVNDSDYDNEDDENYRYNDYPDEEADEDSDEEGGIASYSSEEEEGNIRFGDHGHNFKSMNTGYADDCAEDSDASEEMRQFEQAGFHQGANSY